MTNGDDGGGSNGNCNCNDYGGDKDSGEQW